MVKTTEVPFENQDKRDLGEIKITTGVLEAIAAQATSEVPGIVIQEGQGLQRQVGSFLGLERDAINAKVTVTDYAYVIDIGIKIFYGYSAPEIALQVQDKVKEQILFMTDLAIQEVNVHILAIETESQPQQDSSMEQGE